MTAQEAKVLHTVDNTYYIDIRDALLRLEENEDFKKVILKGYLEDKALASVSLLARHDIKKRGERPDVMEDLVAISSFKEYLFMIHQLGESAQYDEDEINLGE
ncbi:hypothetical protein [Campylobacter fetus]|uniref:hypothetical protein n=1 Tax=Campylobacter fetus TaxID=196 RepID=UPI000818AAB4|nr:hypothetical protein [Campylobacter fetus]OCR88057.1 hypothetical protein CFT13S00388_02505 [Campylobacter fetus subsp. testudinum]RUT50993.1 hypothetical protein BWK67_00270 [Campylobacter fetus]RUT51721.1 hypothetical protein BWK51_00270 [Campylobacter fetus]